MFSRAGFELFKQRTLQRVEEQLEQVGIRNNFIESRVNKFPDERLSELLALVESLSKALEKLLEAATVFHKGACVLFESSKVVKSVSLAYSDSESLRSEASTLEQAFDQGNLLKELQQHVSKPVRKRLLELADIKNRIKEVDILRLEAASRREAVERLRFRPNVNAVQLARGEDQLSESETAYSDALLRLIDEFAVLKRDHQTIFTKAFNSFKLCQHRFAMLATATIGSICGEELNDSASPPHPPQLKQESDKAKVSGLHQQEVAKEDDRQKQDEPVDVDDDKESVNDKNDSQVVEQAVEGNAKKQEEQSSEELEI